MSITAHLWVRDWKRKARMLCSVRNQRLFTSIIDFRLVVRTRSRAKPNYLASRNSLSLVVILNTLTDQSP